MSRHLIATHGYRLPGDSESDHRIATFGYSLPPELPKGTGYEDVSTRTSYRDASTRVEYESACYHTGYRPIRQWMPQLRKAA